MSSDDKENVRYDCLPFSEARQRAFLGHAFKNEKFFPQVKDQVKPEWFTDVWAGKAWRYMVEYNKDRGICSQLPEFSDYPRLKELGPGDRLKVIEAIRASIEISADFKLENIIKDLTSWLHASILHAAIEKSARLFNSKELSKAVEIMRDATKKIAETKFHDEEDIDWLNYDNDLKKQKIQITTQGISFGLDMVDERLNPEGKTPEVKNPNGTTTKSKITGGLLPGDTTVLLAPVNVGKTSCMITVAVHNAMNYKDVLLITHEGRQEDIYKKILMCALEVNERELFDMHDAIANGNQHVKQRFDMVAIKLARYLTYVPMNRPGLTVEEVIAVIRRRHEERVTKFGEGGYKLLVNDYPANLTTERARGGQLQRRQIDDYIYGDFVQLALELKFHALLAIQTNREANKINSRINNGATHDGDYRLLQMEDVAESFGPMMRATNVITVNRSPRDEERGRVTFYICKSRTSEKGIAIVCKSKYACCKTHSNDFGAAWYRGYASMTERIETLLEQYKGNQIPTFELLAKTPKVTKEKEHN